LCLIIKRGFRLTPCADLNKFDSGKIEHLYVHEINHGAASGLTIGVIYNCRPPNCQDEDDEHLRKLLEYVDKIKRVNQLLVMGDFNYSEILWNEGASTSSSRKERFVNKVNDIFWNQHVKEMTKIPVNNEPSLLNLVFTRSKQEVINLVYLPGLGKSDHVILEFECLLSKGILNKENQGPLRRNYYKADFNRIRAAFQEVDWEEKFRDKGADECYVNFCDVRHKVLIDYIPLKVNCLFQNKLKWITLEVKSAIRFREGH